MVSKTEEYLMNLANRMGNGSVSVGFMEGAEYPDGTSVAQVAFWNEYGHGGNFPSKPRPFFRNMIAKEAPLWEGKMGRLAAEGRSGANILGVMGEDIKGGLQESINTLTEPALSKTTLMLREIYGNTHTGIRARDVLSAQELVAEGLSGATGTQAKPLVWTGVMLKSVTYEVED